MLIFLGYTLCPSLKTKQSWQKTLSRLSRCHTLRITGTNPSYFLPQFGIKISFRKFGNLNYFSYLCR